MSEPISRAEHEEFCRRMEAENQRLEDENRRQNRRLDLLEESTRQIGVLATSTEKLALSMEGMAKEQKQQGKRLETLESRDGVMWRKVVSHAITVLVGAAVSYALLRLGIRL